MTDFEDCFWESRDGLRLHYRDYPGNAARPPVLCLPGLTRNARDFADLAARLAGDWRVICADMRGRGDSAYAKDSASYNPLQYVEDVEALLEQAGIARFVVIGTSLGGLMAMLLAARLPGRVAGALLNDIGPEVEPDGLARIREYVGQGRSYPTWMHAARALEELQGPGFPAFGVEDWLAVAKRVMTLGQNGRIVFDYDMKIAEPFNAAPAPEVDLWPAFAALAASPLAVVRGGKSDLLSAQTLARMGAAAPSAELVTVAGVGHAPTLCEPAAAGAIDRLLARVEGGSVGLGVASA